MLRVAQGQDLAKSGYSRDHGWQSQVVNQMAIEGRLDEYWQRNSISIDVSHTETCPPKTITDDRLAPVLQAAITELIPSLEAIEATGLNSQPKCQREVTISQGIQAVREMALHKQRGIDATFTHVADLNQHITNLQSQLAAQAIQYSLEREKILGSLSWRSTRGLRLIHRWVKARTKTPT